MTHRIAPSVELTDHELRKLAGLAYRFGWQRENPQKTWTPAEYKEAARFAVQHLVRQAVGDTQ